MRELIIDNFAGGGGASTGIERALGRPIDVAINHDPEAVAMHMANHPETHHLCQNVWKADPRDVVLEASRRAGSEKPLPVGFAWFSPDCKHFSKAKGGKPVAKNVRDLAWVVVHWAKLVKPRVIMLENVEEFRDWGPLIETEDGKMMPCPVRKGFTFRRWKRELTKLGYKVDARELRASNLRTPTTRKRLYVIARCDGLPIIWPDASTCSPKTKDEGERKALAAGIMDPWRTAAEIIDWSIPCPSIFERKKELAPNTMRRIAHGVKRYVLDAAEPFIVSVAHGDSGGRREYPIDDPLGTVTGGGISHALVAPHITKFRTGAIGSGGDEPMPTVTANSYIKRPGGCAPLGVVGATLVGVGGRMGQSSPRPVDAPYHTTTTKADTAIVIPTLIQTGYGEREGQAPRVPDIDKPLGTVVAGGAKHALIAPVLIGAGGPAYSGKPTAADKPYKSQTTENHTAVVAAFLAQHNSAKGDGVNPGHDARKPVSTLTTSGSHQNVVAAHLLNLKGSDRRDRAIDEPAPSVTAGGLHIAEVRAFLIKYFGTDQDPQLDEPLHTVTTKDRFGLVTIKGEEYVIADIGMRMLTPRELFNAQGFPPDYIIDIELDGRKLPKSSQVRMCGNSVCPPVAEALVRANYAVPIAATGSEMKA